jgi:hypothetical protein
MKLSDIINEEINEMAYPASFSMEAFKNARSFAAKAKYCAERLQRISSGSGRIIYKIDEEKVLKLAKNPKGIAQNEMESDQYVQQQYGDIVTKCFEWDDTDNYWVEMELAQKMTAREFQRIVGVPLNGENSLEVWLIQTFKNTTHKVSPEVNEFLGESEFGSSLQDFIGSYGMQMYDLFRLSSWGKVKRDGKDAAVIVDFGLSEGVWKDHYAPKKQQNRW